MSDEESFVILGSSPLHSMKSVGCQEADGSNISATSKSQVAQDKENSKSPLSSIQINSSNQGQMLDAGSTNGIGASEHAKNKEPSLSNSATSPSASLAASFILGEVDADVLKSSVFSQFPSISMEASAEDVVKLENLMTEHIELKDTLSKVNLTMRRYYNQTLQWKDDMNRMEQQYKLDLLDCQQKIGALRNENLELKRDIETKLCQMSMWEDVRQKDQTELVQSLSEKAAQIENMRVQIEKLEQHQLNENDSKTAPEYVDRLEHTRIVKKFAEQLSELLAENLDLKDVQNRYIDEINCLKVNVVASEELIKQLYSDINLLKANDMEKSNVFTTFENDRKSMKEEIMLLQQQVQLYSKDFEMERRARENLAGEKEGLLQDLRYLQKKNQELIENVQQFYGKMGNQSAAASTPVSSATVEAAAAEQYAKNNISHTNTAPISDSTNRCPVCYKSFKSITILQSHVNYCLDSH